MREYELEVLEQYDVEVISTRKIRGAFFCETKEGTMVLKEAAVSDRRALLLYILLRHLESQGYPEVRILCACWMFCAICAGTGSWKFLPCMYIMGCGERAPTGMKRM